MRLVLLPIAVLLLAGCDQAPPPQCEGCPAILFTVDPQAGVIVLQGIEAGGNASWANVSAQVTGACTVELPAIGPMVAGPVGTVKGAMDKDCQVQISYNGYAMGSWGVGPKARADARASLSKTYTGKDTPTPSPTPEPKGNATEVQPR